MTMSGCRSQMHVFYIANERIPKIEDALADGVEFELTGNFLMLQQSGM
jgi:hypothetical protein